MSGHSGYDQSKMQELFDFQPRPPTRRQIIKKPVKRAPSKKDAIYQSKLIQIQKPDYMSGSRRLVNHVLLLWI
jgi:hypothetical protein